jgi:hypothetical protein
MPITAAIDRTLQCVALAGRSFIVFSTTLSLISSASGFLPGGLERPLTRPDTPASAKYSCQRQTVVLATPTARMIATVPSPSAVISTIRARLAIFWRVFPSATISRSAARSLVLSLMAVGLLLIAQVNHSRSLTGFTCL